MKGKTMAAEPALLAGILKFLAAANKMGYAAGNAAPKTNEDDGSKTILFEEGDWRFHDNYFGGEPYGGREIIFFKGKPVWLMAYYGSAIPEANPELIYPFLRETLKIMPAEFPCRGPRYYKRGALKYFNSWQGNPAKFSGYEEIFQENVRVYSATYIGGMVDQR